MIDGITCGQGYDWSSEESAGEIQSNQKVPDLFKQEYILVRCVPCASVAISGVGGVLSEQGNISLGGVWLGDVCLEDVHPTLQAGIHTPCEQNDTQV